MDRIKRCTIQYKRPLQDLLFCLQEGIDEDEYDEIVEDDRVRFRDQLTSIGMFARQVTGYTL